MRLLLMGVPDNDVVAGVDLLDSFCKEHGITEVMYSSLGPVNTSARMDTIGRTLANKNEAKTISTQTQSMGIMNWMGRSNNDTTIPLWPLRADYVVVLTNPQYRSRFDVMVSRRSCHGRIGIRIRRFRSTFTMSPPKTEPRSLS